jgi:protein-S-isoprenylcysteine O-methyltransferase Ste14
MNRSRPLLGSVIVLYFVIALEVLVMISPFAGFFYAVFNPVLLFLANWPSTRWLADFFLPHMVLPPGILLKAVRVAGSVLFVSGAVVFLVCAGQVYFHKIWHRGPALGGLYRWIRHPQYLTLAVTGIGLAILWPRFLTVVLWNAMVVLYYALARDEERRMISTFGDQYRDYISRTGMFLPRRAEVFFAGLLGPRTAFLRVSTALALLLALTVGGAFALRAYTVAQLPLWTNGRVSVLSILPEDAVMLEHRMNDVLQLPEVRSRLAQGGEPVLGYLVPVQYIMQGMIADTDPAYRLYQHHQTLPMIADWIFHPFSHLEGGHAMMHSAAGGTGATMSPAARRIIFLRVAGTGDAGQPSTLFGIDTVRVPQFFVDIDLHSLTLLEVKNLSPGTGWGEVPTPMF